MPYQPVGHRRPWAEGVRETVASGSLPVWPGHQPVDLNRAGSSELGPGDNFQGGQRRDHPAGSEEARRELETSQEVDHQS